MFNNGTKIDSKLYALQFAWGWLTYLSEGLEKGNLSDNLVNEVDFFGMDEEQAIEIQKMANHEADIILRKMNRLREKHGLNYLPYKNPYELSKQKQ